MNKFFALALATVTTAVFAAPIPSDLDPAFCQCDSAGYCINCDCDFDGNPATFAFNCEPTALEDELFEDEEITYEDYEHTEEEFDELGFTGAVEGTYADYEEVYIVDAETPYTNEVWITPSWCE